MTNRKKNPDATVQEAADFLGVSSRSVLNYIGAKEIEAVKVGKIWYIKRPSLEAFSNRFGLRARQETETPVQLPPAVPRYQDVQVSSMQPSEALKSEALKVEDNQPTKVHTVSALRLFKIAQAVLGRGKWQALMQGHCSMDDSFKRRLFALRGQAIETIGSGYYSFDLKKKKDLYNTSREKVGGILSLLYFQEQTTAEWTSEIKYIEAELLPAYSALIRKMEKKT